jgi:hypothetical protein
MSNVLSLRSKVVCSITYYSLLIAYLKVASFFSVFHSGFCHSVVDSSFTTF